MMWIISHPTPPEMGAGIFWPASLAIATMPAVASNHWAMSWLPPKIIPFKTRIRPQFLEAHLHETRRHSGLIRSFHRCSHRYFSVHHLLNQGAKDALLTLALGDRGIAQMERLIVSMKPFHLVRLDQQE